MTHCTNTFDHHALTFRCQFNFMPFFKQLNAVLSHINDPLHGMLNSDQIILVLRKDYLIRNASTRQST